MGILVPEANLPMGITISNVYMSFSGEVIYTIPTSGQYRINTYYKVYKDDTKQPDTNIRIPLNVQVSDISQGVYTLLYNELKTIYTNSADVLDISVSTPPEHKDPEWVDLMCRVSLYISKNPGHVDLENAYHTVEKSLLEPTSPDTTEIGKLESLYNSLI